MCADERRSTVFAVPLYASISRVHDEIVGVKGAFSETIKGIYNLTRFSIPVELRIVLIKQNILSLKDLAHFIGWNLPMVIHVAFMGMEVYGRAEKYADKVWVEPNEYMDCLTEAVKGLAYRNMHVSIYNLPHCLLPQDLWQYSRKSISDWKLNYLDICFACTKKEECAGFFATSSKIPQGVRPFYS